MSIHKATPGDAVQIQCKSDARTPPPLPRAGQCGAPLVHPESRSRLSKDKSLQFFKQPWWLPLCLLQTFPGLLSRHGSMSQAWDRLDSAVRLEILTGAATIFDVSSGQDTLWGLLNPESPNVTRQGERV